MTTLLSIARQHRGKVSDKWESYFSTYDALLKPYRRKPISLLEIGVQNGGSLEIWAKYLPRARHIVGCDIDPRCGELAFKDRRIEVVVGDANLPPTFDRIAAIARRYAIIIDDGSHLPPDVVASFARYFPLLVPGGLYVIEDLHCAYLRSHHGSILGSHTALDFLRHLVDLINYEHWRRDLDIASLLKDFFPAAVPSFLRNGWVDSVAFQNSLAVVRRAATGAHRKLGERVIVGQSAIVPAILKLRKRRRARRLH